MTLQLEWGSLLGAGVSVVGGLVGSAVSTLLLPGRPAALRARAARAAAVGFLVAATTLLLDFLVEGPPRALDVPSVAEPSAPPAWLSATMPVATTAPDFMLADLRFGTPIRFSELRGERPAVLLFGSFG